MTPGITAVRLTGAGTAPSCRCWCSAPRSARPRRTLWTRVRAPGSTDAFDVRRLGPARATATTARCPTSRSRWPSSPQGVLARRRRRARSSAARTGGPFVYAGRLRRRRGRPPAAARPARPGRRGRAAVHRREDRRRGDVDRPDRPGQRVRHAGDGVRVRRALVRSRLPRAPPRGRLRAAARAAGGRRRGLRPGVRGPRHGSTCATGSPRSAYPSWRWPAATTWPRRPTCCARSPTACRTAAYVELDGVAHLAPAEAPDGRRLAAPPALPRRGPPSPATTAPSARSATPGMVVRREVLGDAHVDRATAGDHRLHPRLPGADHRVRLGQHLDPPRPRPAQPLADHAHRADRPRPPRGARDARAGRPHQRAHGRRDQGAHPADRDLLRRPGRQHRVPHRPAGPRRTTPG